MESKHNLFIMHCTAMPETGKMERELSSSHTHRPTRELKFLLDERLAAAVMAWAREHLVADPHCAAKLGDAYDVNNLYLDTPAFDSYFRSGQPRRPKYRLRRYGAETTIWLEQKENRRGRVTKRRVSIADAELVARLLYPPDGNWPGGWFRDQVDLRRLKPACQVTYRRFARIGSIFGDPVRLTIDSDLRACEAPGWMIPSSPLHSLASLDEVPHILELKFRAELPGMFRRLIQDLRLAKTSFSKYRTSVEACLPLVPLGLEAA